MPDSIEEYNNNTNTDVKYLTRDEFNNVWNELFPLIKGDIPNIFKDQAE